MSYSEMKEQICTNVKKINEIIDDVNLSDKEQSKLKNAFTRHINSDHNGMITDKQINDINSIPVFKEEVRTELENKAKKIFSTVEEYGAKGDGVTDDTLAIQNCISNNSYIEFESNKTYCVNISTPIVVTDDKIIDLNKSTIKVLANDRVIYEVFSLTGENITIRNGTVKGDRYEHKYGDKVWKQWAKNTSYYVGEIVYTPACYAYECVVSGISGNSNYPAGVTSAVQDNTVVWKYLGNNIVGEAGYGLHVKGTNILIENMECSELWGDGIMIARASNVVINNFTAHRNRRQGISVIGVDGLLIDGARITETGGAKPESGIDIEPEMGYICNNIEINNVTTLNNSGVGIQVVPVNDSGSEIIVSIFNHVDKNSENGFFAFQQFDRNYTGSVTLNNCKYYNSRLQGIRIRGYNYNSMPIFINNPLVVDCGTVSAMTIDADTTSATNITCGNVYVDDMCVIDTRTSKITERFIDVFNNSMGRLNNISFTNPKKSILKESTGGKSKIYNVDNCIVSDNEHSLGIVFNDVNLPSADLLLTGDKYFSQITVEKTTATNIILEFDSSAKQYPIGTKINMINMCPKLQIVRSGLTYLPNKTSSSGGISTTEKGASLEIKKIDYTTWVITNQIGTWSTY